jgi:hypothetical protein
MANKFSGTNYNPWDETSVTGALIAEGNPVQSQASYTGIIENEDKCKVKEFC